MSFDGVVSSAGPNPDEVATIVAAEHRFEDWESPPIFKPLAPLPVLVGVSAVAQVTTYSTPFGITDPFAFARIREG
jgi:hypothetical protein